MKLNTLFQILKDGIIALKRNYFSGRRDHYGYIDRTSIVYMPGQGAKQSVYLYENTVIHEYHNFITQSGKFFMRKNSIAALGLTVITSNHSLSEIGDAPGGKGWNNLISNDVIVEEDVWLGAHVTLCPGTHINRGCIVSAGSVCTKNNIYPPYSIIGGIPAKFIKFRFSLEDQINHEKIRFHENERIPTQILEDNYNKFFKT